MEPICCIFGAGCYYGTEQLPDGDFFAISADGGYETALRMGVKPDLHIGDFDSLQSEAHAPEIIRLKPEKDDTDTLSAVKLALKRGFRVFYLYGCTGGRTDHTLSNIQVLAELARRGCRARMIGNREIFAALHNDAIAFSETSQGIISVFSLSDKSHGVTETGLKYPLHNYTMTNGFPIGTSNEFTGQRAEISVQDGTLLLVYTDSAVERR